MAESVNNATLVLNQQDANGVNILNRTIGAFAYSGAVGVFVEGLLTTTGSTALSLPTANVLQFYIKNKHTGAVVTVTATVQGGASQTVTKVQPGGVLVNWCTTSGATAGFTAIALTSDTLSTPYEAFLGG